MCVGLELWVVDFDVMDRGVYFVFFLVWGFVEFDEVEVFLCEFGVLMSMVC